MTIASSVFSDDGGASYDSIGETAPPAVIGAAVTGLPSGPATQFDLVKSVDVELLNSAMWLEGRTDDALIAGANLALLGDELIQFGVAASIGEDRFRLSRLLRGRRGTEWARAGHQIDERFVLLDPLTLKPVETGVAKMGATFELLATGIGDETPAETTLVLEGNAIRPPAPVHLSARRESSGDIVFDWVRRSRIGWAWTDGGDIPLGEEEERWSVSITPDVGTARSAKTDAPFFTYSAVAQAEDGATGATDFTLSIAQLGALAASSPAATAQFTV